MSYIKDIQEKTNVSDYIISQVVHIDEYFLKEAKKWKDSEFPDDIKSYIKTTLTEDSIKKYEHELSNFVSEYKSIQDIADILLKKFSVDEIARQTMVPKSRIKTFISSGYCPSQSSFDRLVDFARMISLSEREDSTQSLSEDIDRTVSEMPEDKTSKLQEENEGLSRQIDWYEKIIDSFCTSIELIKK